jgi:hypothetical protein
MIKQSLTALGLVTVVLMQFSVESAMAQDSEPDWSFSVDIGWAWRDIDGIIFDYTPPLVDATRASFSNTCLSGCTGRAWVGVVCR